MAFLFLLQAYYRYLRVCIIGLCLLIQLLAAIRNKPLIMIMKRGMMYSPA